MPESLGGSWYFVTLQEDKTSLLMATPMKARSMVSGIIKARVTLLETLTGLKVRRIWHDGAQGYSTDALNSWFDIKGITSEETAPYASQQNGKVERGNRMLMVRVRAALSDAGAEDDLWAEALAAVIHALNRSPKPGVDVTPLEAFMGRRPNVAGFRVWESLEWALRPSHQQRKLQPRTSVGLLVGYTVGGKA